MQSSFLAIGMPGAFEWIIIAGIGLLLFGKRLPDVGKGLARSIVEFKKGLREVTDEIDAAGTPKPPSSTTPPNSAPPSA